MQGAGSVKQQISNLVALSLRATVPEVDVEPIVEVCTGKFGDYQWYVPYVSVLFDDLDMCDSCSC